MLLVLYLEYVARMKEPPFIKNDTLSYSGWLEMLRGWADVAGYESFGDMVRECIEPTYQGA